ncbi:MAG: hypothetical protein KA804_06520 [Ottowia sp.]|nr:hypothetical protein [Ottowia sp.]MBP9673352.1 hypothetical protein [Ottowia sp.]
MNAPVTLPPPAETETPDTLAATANSLAAGTRLGEFELRGVLGEGGFAIVYKAHDKSLRRTVAIKEYMPGAIATRTPDGSVVPREASVAGTPSARAGQLSGRGALAGAVRPPGADPRLPLLAAEQHRLHGHAAVPGPHAARAA